MENHFGKFYPRWHNIYGKCHCYRCYKKLIDYPNNGKKQDKKRQPRRVLFLGKRIRLSYYPRTGNCSWCSNNVYDGSAKRTSRHHLFYLPIMVWACTEEICNSCHINESIIKQNSKIQSYP